MQQVIVNGEAITPSKVLCVGRNFVDHIAELGNEVPEDMVVFNKPNSAISETLYAFHQEPLHYEAELCFVIKNQQLFAIGIGLDLTKRQLQSALKEKGLPWERAKAFDHSAVFSEFVSIDGINFDQDLRFQLRINGLLVQDGNVELMLYKPLEILAELQTYTQVNDGDIVMTGTPKGVGQLTQGSQIDGSVFVGDQILVSKTWWVK